MRLRGTWRRGTAIAKAFKGAGTPRLQAILCSDDKGLGLLRDPSNPESFPTLFAWADVGRVIAFKRDLLLEDLICLRFEAAGSAYDVHEEMAGWDELLTQLPERLPGSLSKDTVFALVALPAFAANETVVFERRPA